jgi:hypothetical protein
MVCGPCCISCVTEGRLDMVLFIPKKAIRSIVVQVHCIERVKLMLLDSV